jgi:hypothetical protein
MRRLWRFTSKFTNNDIDFIINLLDPSYLQVILDVVENVDYVEYLDKDGYACSINSMDDDELQNSIDMMNTIYGKKAYELDDVTELAIKGTLDLSCSEEDKQPEIDKLLNRYLITYMTKDDVLDKISEFGIESLTEIDYKILESN